MSQSNIKVVVRLGALFEAEDYGDAGDRLEQLLDRARELDWLRITVTGFETRPCQAEEFDAVLYDSGVPYRDDAEQIEKVAQRVAELLRADDGEA